MVRPYEIRQTGYEFGIYSDYLPAPLNCKQLVVLCPVL